MANESFRGKVPDDRLYDTDHDMWLLTEDGEVVIGATSFGIHLAGEIIAFTAKPTPATIERGRGLGTIECAKTVLAVHSPVAFTLTEANEEVELHPARLNRDSYSAWMVRGRPTDWANDRARLVDAATYRDHVHAMDPGAVIE